MLSVNRFATAFRLTLALALVCFVAAGLQPGPRAAPGPDVKVTVEVLQEIIREDADGNLVTDQQPVGLASPGDILVYTVRAENLGDGPAFDPRLQDPVPEGTVLLPESVTLKDVTTTASLDGGETWEPFPVRILVGEDDNGQPRYEQVPAEAYTNLRWNLTGPLGPGEAKEVSFKVRVR
jgi:uncharacterized repeat protein (TIGR01451 family)